MKRIILAIALILSISVLSYADIRYVVNSFVATDATDIATEGSELGSKNMTASLTKFEDTYDGDGKRGLIRISFKNLSNEDIRDKVTVSINPGHAGQPTYVNNPKDNHLECWVQVDPYENMIVDVTVDGVGSVRIPGLNVKGEKMYAMTLESDETIVVTFTSTVEGTEIWLDGIALGGRAGQSSTVSAENVSLGTHKLKAKAPNGKIIEEEIEVSKTNNHFPLDLMEYVDVDFRSNETGVQLFEDEKMIAVLPAKVKVAVGPHSYVVKRPGYKDVNHTINITQSGIQKLDIYKTKNIDFYSMYNNTDVTGASLYINNELKGETPMALELPYGSYMVKMSRYGREKSQRLTVNDGTPSTYRIVLPNFHTRFNPFTIDWRLREVGITASWVQKWYVFKDGNSSMNVNYWGEESHMNGFQVGIPVQPMFGYGIGMNTGLFYEMYFTSITEDTDYHLTEMDLYMPIDLMFRLPLGEQCSLYVNGGIGIDWSLGMKVSADGYDDSISLDYGEEGMPNRFNFSGEFGVGFQIKALQISAQYQIGLSDNKNFYYELGEDEGKLSCKMRKLAVQLSLMF